MEGGDEAALTPGWLIQSKLYKYFSKEIISFLNNEIFEFTKPFTVHGFNTGRGKCMSIDAFLTKGLTENCS